MSNTAITGSTNSQNRVVAALLTVPNQTIKHLVLFNSGEPWEKFHEKFQEVTKEKATSFSLSYVWQSADVSLTKESWAASIHYFDGLSKDSAVIIEMKSFCLSVNNKIMHDFSGKDMLIIQYSERKVNSPLLRDQRLQHPWQKIQTTVILLCLFSSCGGQKSFNN